MNHENGLSALITTIRDSARTPSKKQVQLILTPPAIKEWHSTSNSQSTDLQCLISTNPASEPASQSLGRLILEKLDLQHQINYIFPHLQDHLDVSRNYTVIIIRSIWLETILIFELYSLVFVAAQRHIS